MYAIVETGGKQYKVAVGDTVDVERLEAEVGEAVALDRVLIVADDNGIKVGKPVLDGAHVSATVLEQTKGPKVLIYKFHAKKHYRSRQGHRQQVTRLRIDAIQA